MYIHTYTYTGMHIPVHVCTMIDRCSYHTYTNSLTRTHTHARTHTHMCTHTLSFYMKTLSLPFSLHRIASHKRT